MTDFKIVAQGRRIGASSRSRHGRSSHRLRIRLGYTLVELLTTVSIIGLLITLMLPAVQSARETSRRAQCANNLKQIGLALHVYEGAFECLPPGRMMTYDSRYSGRNPPCTSPLVEKSLFMHITAQIGEQALFNAMNSSLTIFGCENRTVRTTALSTFACPSDPDSGLIRDGYSVGLYSLGLASSSNPYPVYYSSYAGVYGSFYLNAVPRIDTNCRVPPLVLSEVNGSFNDTSPIRLSSFTDGLTWTATVMERALSPLRGVSSSDGPAFDRFGWLISGNWGDSLVTTFYPPNMYRKVSPPSSISQFFAASSLHPGGLNILMGDGSVRFVKDTVSSWPFDSVSGQPLGILTGPTGEWVNAPASGVWQSLATRNGGEVIGIDSF